MTGDDVETGTEERDSSDDESGATTGQSDDDRDEMADNAESPVEDQLETRLETVRRGLVDAAEADPGTSADEAPVTEAIETLTTAIGEERISVATLCEQGLLQWARTALARDTLDGEVRVAIAGLLAKMAAADPDPLLAEVEGIRMLTRADNEPGVRATGFLTLNELAKASDEPPAEPEAVDQALDDVTAATEDVARAAATYLHTVAREAPDGFVSVASADRLTAALPTDDPFLALHVLGAIYCMADTDVVPLFEAGTVEPMVETLRRVTDDAETVEGKAETMLENASRVIEEVAEVNLAPFMEAETLELLLALAEHDGVGDEMSARLLGVHRRVAAQNPDLVLPFRDRITDLYTAGDSEVKVTGAWVLSNLAETRSGAVAPSAPALAAELDHDVGTVRANSVHALANIAIEDPLAVLETEPLREIVTLLDDEETQVRVNALLALRRLGSAHPHRLEAVIDDVLDRMTSETDPAVHVFYLLFGRAVRDVYPEARDGLTPVIAGMLAAAPVYQLMALEQLVDIADTAPAYAVPHAPRLVDLCGQSVSAADLARLDEDTRDVVYDVLGELGTGSYEEIGTTISFAAALVLQTLATELPQALPVLDERVVALTDHDDEEVRGVTLRLLETAARTAPSRVDPAAGLASARGTARDDVAERLYRLLAVRAAPPLRLAAQVAAREDGTVRKAADDEDGTEA